MTLKINVVLQFSVSIVSHAAVSREFKQTKLGTGMVLFTSKLHIPVPPLCLYHQLTDYTRSQIQDNSEPGAK